MSQGRSLGTVLVVGGTGFLGAQVIDQLLNFPSEDNLPPVSSEPKPTKKYTPESVVVEAGKRFPSLRSRYPSYSPRGTTVHGLDLSTARNRIAGATYHDCDITDADKLSSILDSIKPDIIINTASPPFTSKKPILQKVNVEGTATLLSAAQKAGAKCFVHTSSASVVHDTRTDLINATEAYPYVCPNPNEYYSETKALAEQAVLKANDPSSNFLTCAVRPAGIIGEGDRHGFAYAIIDTGSKAPSWQLNMQLGDGTPVFDVTYAGNVAYGLLSAAAALRETHMRQQEGKTPLLDFDRVDGEAFNVTNDSPAYFWDLSRAIWVKYGREIKRNDQLWELPAGLAEFAGSAAELVNWVLGRDNRFTAQGARYACMHRYFSCEKLKRRTGYKPVVGVEEGLERSIAWYKEVVVGQERKKGQ
jgi:sterol-4alpha-carboxylate 3-dehydrogenase (decarboxylating)